MNARLSSLLLVVALGLAGCVDRLVPVEFYGLCGFPRSLACEPPAGKCTTYQNGQLYLYYENEASLDMVAEFQNQRPNNENLTPGGSNTANAMITEYRFKFSASPPVALASRTVPYLSTPISAGGTATVWIPVLPFETVAELLALPTAYDGFISVEITPRGRFGDGSSFEVGPLTVPVWAFSGLPPASTCPDPTDVPAFCPSEFQTHATICSGASSTASYVLGGTISGLSGSGLVLATPGLPNLAVSSGSSSFAFPTSLPDGSSYDVTIVSQPAGQTCTVNNGSGTVSGADVGSVTISCI